MHRDKCLHFVIDLTRDTLEWNSFKKDLKNCLSDICPWPIRIVNFSKELRLRARGYDKNQMRTPYISTKEGVMNDSRKNFNTLKTIFNTAINTYVIRLILTTLLLHDTIVTRTRPPIEIGVWSLWITTDLIDFCTTLLSSDAQSYTARTLPFPDKMILVLFSNV